MILPEFLRFDEYGEIFLVGHRITLHHVIKDYRDGYSAQTLAAAFPTLALALVHKVIAFYLEKQSEIEQYMEETGAASIDNPSSARSCPCKSCSFPEGPWSSRSFR